MKIPKKILVITGSSGFVGERLANIAIAQGYDVIGIDYIKSSNLTCHQLELDLSRQDFFEQIPADSVFIHLASLSTDSLCREQPTLAIDANLRATSLALENAVKSKVSHFIFASSEWVYPENSHRIPQTEEDNLDLANLDSLYAMTKLFGESLIRSTAKVPYTVLRFGIVYGPRKSPGSSAESVALKVHSGEEISVGSLETSRRFIFIDDLVEGILRTVSVGPERLNGEILNLAGPELVSLQDLVTASNEILQSSAPINSGGKSPSIRNPIIGKAELILDWRIFRHC
jgi:UDP-glucose 4-epimerase